MKPQSLRKDARCEVINWLFNGLKSDLEREARTFGLEVRMRGVFEDIVGMEGETMFGRFYVDIRGFDDAKK